jgi:antitoxin ParD1/3/4
MENRAMTFRIVLDKANEDFIQRMMDSGRYDSPSNVVLDALQMLEDREVALEARRTALLASIDEAIADIDQNGGIPAEQVFEEMEELIRSKERRDAAE